MSVVLPDGLLYKGRKDGGVKWGEKGREGRRKGEKAPPPSMGTGMEF